jgi:membrane protein YqaA with SNARE-associated domain/catechol 2,3-dioxygenase-like lactoylglutathione lyase family enzyme
VTPDRLGRRYRRLVRAYPSGPRREELLDTLLSAVPPGRTRPTPADTLNLLRHGLRARLGRPGSRWVVVTAVLVAVTFGYAGAAFAARATWNAVPDYPSGARLAEITGTVFPGLPIDDYRSQDGLFLDISEQSFAEQLLFGRNEDFEYATYDFGPDGGNYVAGSYRPWTDAAVARLEAAGWTVRDVWPTGNTWIATGALDESGRAFWATRDGLSIEFEASTITNTDRMPPGSFFASASLTRLPPWYVTAASAAGLLLGALLGWLLTGWVSRRTERAVPGARVTSHTTGALALIITLPQTLFGLLGLVAEPLELEAPVAPFWALSLTYGYGCVLLGLLLTVIAMVTATAGARAAGDPVTEPGR